MARIHSYKRLLMAKHRHPKAWRDVSSIGEIADDGLSQGRREAMPEWVPAFAGMTSWDSRHLSFVIPN